MSLPPDYLTYRHRRYGMDHDRYGWSILPHRKPVSWPNGARIALWVVPALEWFPLDMKGKPFKPPGALVTSYPDLRHYTLRDYGNRVGIFRVMKALDQLGIRASVAVNAAVAARHPSLVKTCIARGWEVIGNGLDMDHLHYEGLPNEEERRLIEDSLAILRGVSGQKIRGWLSPARSESFATLDLVAAAGIDYVCDWINDDMPYAMHTQSRSLHSLPLSNDIDDYTILVQNRHAEDAYAQQVCDQFDVLYKESETQGGRILALSLHPWVIGQPYRIGALERALKHVMGHKGVWAATGSEILDAFTARQ
ncbi:MAG TPA: polysaccharide deacetylase family protein [Stellaceae bacterium]|nr:polysaccharide deacetylase family protein [Stellaceae bacterium]